MLHCYIFSNFGGQISDKGGGWGEDKVWSKKGDKCQMGELVVGGKKPGMHTFTNALMGFVGHYKIQLFKLTFHLIFIFHKYHTESLHPFWGWAIIRDKSQNVLFWK